MSFSRLIYGAFVLLCACNTGGNFAPVDDLHKGSSIASKTYVVSRGETLYSIAWSHNMRFRGLADANNISAPYTIYPGQVLQMVDRPPAASRTTKSTKVTSAGSTQTRPPAAVKTGANKSVSAATTGSINLDASQYPFRWQWPANGKFIRAYQASGAVHKGIDIQGKLGEPVHAANSGIVVYAGSGLKGYGNLLIIKHNEYYLSAYGHNSKLLVKEGDKVRSGQQIARIGDTGTNEFKLHFEIRRDGKPVDPLKLLPKK